jgi:hypothetical protein
MRAEAFSCSLDVLHEGLGIKQTVIFNYFYIFSSCKMLKFLVIRIDLKFRIRIQIRIRNETNADAPLMDK